MPVGKPLHLRLFLEGEEVPVISAQVSINVNAPATAAIQVVPLDSALNLLPRTMVHLFFLDMHGGQATYRLLFSGEFIAYSFVQTPQSRALILQCLDFSNYWDTAQVTAITYGPFGNLFTNVGSLYGGASGTFTDLPGDSAAERLVRWVRQKPATPGLKGIGGLAGGVIHVMEAMGGVPGHHKGINDFFTSAELRCRILSQISAEEKDDTAARVLTAGVFHQWLKNGIQQMGGQVTFRDVMKLLFNYIYYEFVPNPAAKFDDASVGEKKRVNSTGPLVNHPAVAKVVANLSTQRIILEEHLDPKTSAGVEEDLIRKVYAGISTELLNVCVDGLNKVKPQSAEVVEALDELADAAAFLFQVGDSIGKIDLDLVKSAHLKVLRAYNALKDGRVSGSKSVVLSEAQRLRTQIIRPDCWFASPPACNVIFPEDYAQITYDRNYLAETTRLLVQVFDSLVGQDVMFSDKIIAPRTGFSNQDPTKYAAGKSYRMLMDHEIHVGIQPRVEWIPNHANAGNSADRETAKKVKDHRLGWTLKASLFHFFKYRFGSRQASVATRFNPFMVCGFPAVVITKPYIIPGGIESLKTAAGTTPTDEEVLGIIHEKASKLGAPSHLIGMVGGMSHNVDQNGGTTSVTLHHVRQSRGVDDEFLGVLLETNEGKVDREVKVVLNLRELQARGDKAGVDLLCNLTPTNPTPRQTVTTKKKVVRQSREVSTESVDPREPASGNKTVAITTAPEAEVEVTEVAPNSPPVGTQVAVVKGADALIPSPPGKISIGGKGYYGGKISEIEVPPDVEIVPVEGRNAFSSIILYETIKVPVEGRLPVEEALRPAWFSGSYSNANIGNDIYRPFFGCGSVVEGLGVEGLESQAATEEAGTIPSGPPTRLDEVIKRVQSEEAARRSVSLEKALDVLGYFYGRVKTEGKDVDEFVRSYTYREIATKEDIFGDSNLQFSITPPKAIPKSVNGTLPRIGFHTGAVHRELVDAGGFTGLLDDLNIAMRRVGDEGDKETLSPRYDVRPAKKARVIAYVTELEKGPGFKG